MPLPVIWPNNPDSAEKIKVAIAEYMAQPIPHTCEGLAKALGYCKSAQMFDRANRIDVDGTDMVSFNLSQALMDITDGFISGALTGGFANGTTPLVKTLISRMDPAYNDKLDVGGQKDNPIQTIEVRFADGKQATGSNT